ncbi:uncharacterized protein LOC135496587 [Lineus longissimus]|uniref:uncharacterized protein LOC135496587 n=1 Tax=Lineus longissimus TaxID=88925 RepID=UPI00315CEE18
MGAGMEMLEKRNKIILLADSLEHGWKTVREYESNPLAEDSDDEQKILKAELRAGRKLKAAAGAKRGGRGGRRYGGMRMTPYNVYSAPGGFSGGATAPSQAAVAPVFQPQRGGIKGACFSCGATTHWKAKSPTMAQGRANAADLHRRMMAGAALASTHPDVSSPVGRLRSSRSFWESAGASQFILDVIDVGYQLPFYMCPAACHLANNRSALVNAVFVEEEIAKLYRLGCISVCEEPPLVVNPLSVAVNAKDKKRLILDLRYVNMHLLREHFKMEDMLVGKQLFDSNELLFVFDIQKY